MVNSNAGENMPINWEAFGIKRNSGVTLEMVSSVQKNLGIVLPETYVDLVMYSDGACPEISSFEYQDDGTCISEFFEFSDEVRPYTITWYTRPGGLTNLPDRFVPIARDAGDYLICLDFNKSPASIVVFDPISQQSFFVANSFGEFVSLWHE
ncbi:MAG: SMI1/KNR4 family protein [Halothiobacillaceae bacterium]|nr:SMI1/KNR4 family protein [Halothiobacillaceae bacterium]